MYEYDDAQPQPAPAEADHYAAQYYYGYEEDSSPRPPNAPAPTSSGGALPDSTATLPPARNDEAGEYEYEYIKYSTGTTTTPKLYIVYTRTYNIYICYDVILTIGVFCFTQLEFNLPIIAAILTIVGYSMNDTVVVYDRVRENLRKHRSDSMLDLLNLSINNTLSRTIMTSVTTLLALVSLYVFGGSVIKGFTFAMIWGVLVGTYSSLFIASPIMLDTIKKKEIK